MADENEETVEANFGLYRNGFNSEWLHKYLIVFTSRTWAAEGGEGVRNSRVVASAIQILQCWLPYLENGCSFKCCVASYSACVWYGMWHIQYAYSTVWQSCKIWWSVATSSKIETEPELPCAQFGVGTLRLSEGHAIRKLLLQEVHVSASMLDVTIGNTSTGFLSNMPLQFVSMSFLSAFWWRPCLHLNFFLYFEHNWLSTPSAIV